jgi:Domain of unknown function (DUF4430)
MSGRARTALGAIVAVAIPLLAGCGLGSGRGTSDVTLTGTRAFGTTQVGTVTDSNVPGSETVMRMLQRSFRVTTQYGGGFVESIDGQSGSASHLDWFYYVNGIEAPQGAASTGVHRGDRIWWDLHDWSVTDSIPAVVGSFPDPFVHGEGGKRLPTVLECGSGAGAPCTRVSNALAGEGVPVATQLLGAGAGNNILTVLVAPWPALNGTFVSRLLGAGPTRSGVYARFAGTRGQSLQLLDPKGNVVRTLGAGAGLIAATNEASSGPTWVITGTDAAGVAAAAAAFTEARLHDHFALAVQGGADLPVPLRAAS